MQYYRIPHISLKVRVLGLGAMICSKQNTQTDTHTQLGYALAISINLMDAAKMYLAQLVQKHRG